ncbi:MAG: hypothetical protein PVG75_13980 [Thioalkalispiraceae bacterium]|jgi:hypothetical protein
MKYVDKTATLDEANQIKTLLESRGIPAFVSNKRYARLSPPFTPYYLGVFIYIDSQYEDALALINNPEHTVKQPVDVTEFYQLLDRPEHKQAVYQAMNHFIGWMLVVGIVCIVLIYILSQY